MIETTAALAFGFSSTDLQNRAQQFEQRWRWPDLRRGDGLGGRGLVCRYLLGRNGRRASRDQSGRQRPHASQLRANPIRGGGATFWEHEIRLIQTPIAFVDTHQRVVPPAPTITALIDGSDTDGYLVDEVQKLTVDPAFRGKYQLSWRDGKSDRLAAADTALFDRGRARAARRRKRGRRAGCRGRRPRRRCLDHLLG